jgi:hypothetical protein
MPRTVRMTVGFSGVGSILRRMRVMRRSIARSNGSRLRWLVVSSSQSRDSGRLGFSAKVLRMSNSPEVRATSLPSLSSSWRF